MLDTNILISALVFGGKAQMMIERLLLSENEVWVSEYVKKEFFDKLYEKWTDKAENLMSVLQKLPIHFCDSSEQKFGSLRDEKDIPILSDALYHGIDVILTGDKDFLEADLKYPLIFSLGMLEEYLERSR